MLLLDEVRLTRDAMRYGFAVGKVRVLETKRLDPGALERLLDARTFAEQKRLLSDTPYGGYLEHAQTAEQVEAGLDAALESFYAFLDAAALPVEVTRFFRLRYDFANLKASAKARLLGASTNGLLADHGTVALDAFEGDLTGLPEPLGEVAATLPLAEQPGDAEPDATVVDTLVDKAMFAELVATARSSRSEFLVDLARLAIDLANVKTLVRASRARLSAEATVPLLIDGGSVPLAQLEPLAGESVDAIAGALARMPQLKSLAAGGLESPVTIDPTLDAVTQAALRRGGAGRVGPEPVISYVFEREAEVAMLRVLLLGRLAGLSQETMRRRVRSAG